MKQKKTSKFYSLFSGPENVHFIWIHWGQIEEKRKERVSRHASLSGDMTTKEPVLLKIQSSALEELSFLLGNIF